MKYAIIIFLSSTIIPVVLALMRNNKNENQKDVFCCPRLYVFVAFLGFAVFGIAYAALFISGQIYETPNIYVDIMLAVVGVLLIWGSTYLLLCGLNFRLELRQNEIVYRNIFRKTYIINYTDVLEIISWYFPNETKKMEKYKIVTKTKKITLSYMDVNFNNLIQILKNRLRKNKVQCKFTIKKGIMKY